MKKIFLFAMVSACGLCAHAQDVYSHLPDNSMLSILIRVLGVALLIYLIGNILLNLIKMLLDYQLKRRLVEKGTSETVVAQLLQTNKKEGRFNALKWAVILGSIGIGLLLVSQFQPFGVHSLVILTFCLASAFLAYYFLLKKSEE